VDFTNVFQVVAGIAGGVAGAFTLWKLVGRPAWRSIGRARDLVANATEILRVLHAIEKDFRPNGGSSFRDAITRIESWLVTFDERQKALLNLSTDGLFEADAGGACVYTNREYAEISGLHGREALDNGWIVALHPEDRNRVVTEWRHAVADRRDFLSRYRFSHPCGEVVPVVCHASAMKRPTGELIGYIGSVRREVKP
jgi:PAS domain S-box-containing protein